LRPRRFPGSPPALPRRKAALDTAQQNLAALRQADGASAALEQGGAEIGFETGNGAAQRRLTDAEMLGGAGDVLKPPGSAEMLELVQLETQRHSAPPRTATRLCNLVMIT
jgi:hypothetical protein